MHHFTPAQLSYMMESMGELDTRTSKLNKSAQEIASYWKNTGLHELPYEMLCEILARNQLTPDLFPCERQYLLKEARSYM